MKKKCIHINIEMLFNMSQNFLHIYIEQHIPLIAWKRTIQQNLRKLIRKIDTSERKEGNNDNVPIVTFTDVPISYTQSGVCTDNWKYCQYYHNAFYSTWNKNQVLWEKRMIVLHWRSHHWRSLTSVHTFFL